MTAATTRLKRVDERPWLVRQCEVCGFVEAFPEYLVEAWGGVLELPRWECPNSEHHDGLAGET